DLIYLTEKEKWDAVVAEIERIHKWDVLRLKDDTELHGTIIKETKYDVLRLKDGTELHGRITKETKYDVLVSKDGNKRITRVGKLRPSATYYVFCPQDARQESLKVLLTNVVSKERMHVVTLIRLIKRTLRMI